MSFTPARVPFSSQTTIHQALHKTVAKHNTTVFLKPIAEHNREAFEQFLGYRKQHPLPRFILDSGCGVGQSTRRLAAQNPDALVVGIDRSLKRLAHSDNQSTEANCLFLRSDCEDFWRLLQQQKIFPDRHFLLYPNPYPKANQLTRRWHGHGVFPVLMAISPVLELRSNWEIYVDEFIAAARQLNAVIGEKEHYQNAEGLTAFEQKYSASGHQLWRCILRHL